MKNPRELCPSSVTCPWGALQRRHSGDVPPGVWALPWAPPPCLSIPPLRLSKGGVSAGREWARDCPVRLKGHGRLPRVRQDWMGGDKARPPGKIRARLVLVTRGPSLSSGSCQRPRAVAQPPDRDCSSQGPRRTPAGRAHLVSPGLPGWLAHAASALCGCSVRHADNFAGAAR